MLSGAVQEGPGKGLLMWTSQGILRATCIHLDCAGCGAPHIQAYLNTVQCAGCYNTRVSRGSINSVCSGCVYFFFFFFLAFAAFAAFLAARSASAFFC